MRVQEHRPILVVDDDAKIVRLVRAYLEREGYRVVGATDGRAALTAVELERPALIVLDPVSYTHLTLPTILRV